MGAVVSQREKTMVLGEFIASGLPRAYLWHLPAPPHGRPGGLRPEGARRAGGSTAAEACGALDGDGCGSKALVPLVNIKIG